MELFSVKLLFDFGLMVLIWMVQIVVYPAFKYLNKEKLLLWHKQYSQGITIIVVPLMMGQLTLSGLLLFYESSTYRISDLILVLLVWMITFSQFVPMHGAITKGKGNQVLLKNMVERNWFRTAIWSIIFLLNLLLIFQ